MAGKKFWNYFRYICINISIAAVLSVILIHFIISPFKIKGDSMEPGLAPEERIIILKILVRPQNLNRFDIVVFRKPNDPNRKIIKRIVGCPGETVEIKEDTLYIDGKAVSQSFLGQNQRHPSPPTLSPPGTIPPNHYYVIGDNWNRSIDSRVFGVVPLKNIIGKAIFRYWPLSRFGKLR